MIQRIAVFCGSGSGTDPLYVAQANALGKVLASRRIGLVYGGALVGLMGAVADGALSAGGEVTGVIPAFLRTREIAHEGLSSLMVVESMHERKQRMYDLSDAFLALPGGFGTMEEFFEMLTWAQLGLHGKPMGLLNTQGFYDHLLALLDGMVERGFLREVNRQMIQVSDHIDGLLEKLERYVPQGVDKWIRTGQV